MAELDCRLRAKAQSDIQSIFAHYRISAGKEAALKRIEGIYASLAELCAFPDIGKPIPSDQQRGIGFGYRKWLGDEFWIYYSHNNREVTIWRIVHMRQDIDDCELIEL